MAILESALTIAAAIKLVLQLIEAAKLVGARNQAEVWQADLEEIEKSKDVSAALRMGRIIAVIIDRRLRNVERQILKASVENNPATLKPTNEGVEP